MAPAEMHQRTRPQVEPRLLDRVRETIRRKHYSLRTEMAYIDWIKRYIFFHRKWHPAEMGAPEMEQFLNHLAVDRRVASSTQNQALSALVFLYREVLRQDFEWMENLDRAKRPSRLPVVLTESEVHNLLAHLDGQNWLMASLLYGAGLRLMECIRLRVKDIDFEYRQLTVRDGKGAHDRVTMLPEASSEVLRTHLARVRSLHQQDLASGGGANQNTLRRTKHVEKHAPAARVQRFVRRTMNSVRVESQIPVTSNVTVDRIGRAGFRSIRINIVNQTGRRFL